MIHHGPGRCTERELTEPTSLCEPDGALRLDAVGWSRRPLHTCNLRGWGRTKRWDYWCVTDGATILAITVADLDYLGLLSVWWCDLRTRRTSGRQVSVPLGMRLPLPDTVSGGDIVVEHGGIRVELLEHVGGTRIRAKVSGPGHPIEADVMVVRPPDHETLNVVIPWSRTRFQFTSKQNALPAEGLVRVGRRDYAFSSATGAFATLDYGRGRWPYRTIWNWGSAAGQVDGRVLGLQLGGKWTEGTGFTENALCVDGRLHKLSEEMVWRYDRRDFSRPWTIRSPVSDRVDLVFSPVYERRDRTEALLLGNRTSQCFGRFHGSVVSDDGENLEIPGLFGWAEEVQMRW